MKTTLIYLFCTVIVLISLASCTKNAVGPIDATSIYSAEMVLKWNEAGMKEVAKINPAPPQ